MIVCTFPGKHGDLLWALPTVRAIAETYQEQVLLMISPYVKSLAPLLRQQDYIYSCVVPDDWLVHMTAPITPRIPPMVWPVPPNTPVFHLGYEGWPEPTLPVDIWARANRQALIAPFDLDRPWITPPSYAAALPPVRIAVGFTDEWFELKYGLYQLLRNKFTTPDSDPHTVVNLSTSPRWVTETLQDGMDWLTAAAWMSRAQVFVGCCSALHVLACAIGTPVVVVEPSEPRHQDVFYPYGKDSPRLHLLMGNDGKPTFDARHLMDELAVRV